MNIYLIVPTEEGWKQMQIDSDEPTYDVNEGWIVVAKNAKMARAMTVPNIEDEPEEVWLNAKLSSCTKIGEAHGRFKKPQVIMRKFHPG